MTTIIGDVRNIVNEKMDGTVRIQSLDNRPARSSTGVIIDDWSDYELKAGQFKADNVDPGKARIWIIAGSTSHIFDVVVPKVESVTFASLLLGGKELPPLELSHIEQIVAESSAGLMKTKEYADAAKESATQASSYSDSANKAASDAASAAGPAAAKAATEAAGPAVSDAVAKLDATVRWNKDELGDKDLNTVLVPGAYSQSGSANVTLERNYPVVKMRGVLEVLPVSVINNNAKIQRYILEDGSTWVRRIYGSGNWTKWAQVALPGIDEVKKAAETTPAPALPPTKQLGEEDLNSLTTPGDYAQTLATSATPERHYPVNERGLLSVLDSNPVNPNQKIQRYISASSNRVWIRNIYGADSWSEWVLVAGSANPAEIKTSNAVTLTDEDLNKVLTPGSYAQPSATNATPERHYPAKDRGAVMVLDPNTANPNQKIQVFISSSSNRVWIRNIYGRDNWSEWVEFGGAGGAASATVLGTPYQHLMRERELRRRIGPVKSEGKGIVAFVMDHGTKNFRDIVVPALRERKMRVTLSLNSDRLNPSFRHYASEGDVPWETVKAWVDEGLIEVANHSATHALDTSPDKLRDEIIGSREALEGYIGKSVDSWVQPGISKDAWDGFDNGTSPEKYWATAAGSMILDGHAVISRDIVDSISRGMVDS